MARSKYIYALCWGDGAGVGVPLACRTVKREMVDFVRDLPNPDDLEVWRYTDGIPYGSLTNTHLGTAREFLTREVGG